MSTFLTFHGAAGEVTGSCIRIEHGEVAFLVDCGLHQGPKTVRELNYRPFPFALSSIGFVLVTHAHIDHTGLLPKLYAEGWRGPVYATAPTIDLLSFMLPDAGHIQEIEVEQLNERNRRRGRPAVTPIYTKRDGEEVVGLCRPVPYGVWQEPAPGVRARWWNAGHILGSASIELELARPDGRPLRLLVSGDIGPDEKAFHDRPDAPSDLDHLIVESTYGDRERAETTVEDRRRVLAREVREGLARGGNVLIPSFAVERTQEVLYALVKSIRLGDIPPAPIFIDSPLAIRITEVFRKYADALHEVEDAREIFVNPYVRYVETVEQSRRLASITGGAIIMAASGMCEAGRIRHHLENNLWREDATVIFVGYQAPGTLGRIILDGAPMVRIHGREIRVRARIRDIEAYSAHADRGELLAWAKARLPVHGSLFLVHGEPKARDALAAALPGVGYDAARILKPDLDDRFRLDPARPPEPQGGPRRLDPAKVRAGEDWHNRYARLVLEISERLRALPSDALRERLLDELERALASDLTRRIARGA